MGSGRGKTRRAQSATADEVARTAQYEATIAWRKFTENQEIADTKLAEYYGLGAGSFRSLRASRLSVAYLAEEFFHDLVAIGIIALPPGRSSAEINFRVDHKQNNYAVD